MDDVSRKSAIDEQYTRRAMMGEQQWQFMQQFWPIEWISREELMRRYPRATQPEQPTPALSDRQTKP